jgi:carboxypeptidase family protein
MTRRVLGLAAAVLALAAPSAAGYSHISEQVGSQVLPQHWRTSSLPIDLTVDGGPTNVLAEINAATATWNGVTTARTTWGAATLGAVDFDKNNLGSAWGDLTGDGKHEVVVDEDGSIIRSFGLAPGSVNGAGITGGVINGGEAEINDMYLLINGSRTDFDRPSTEVHELGHTLGLGHASAGFAIGKDGALEPLFPEEVPTMHPFSIGTTDRRTLAPDDLASLSELYPNPNGSFAATTGTITGTVTRCGSGDPVLGANVRAVNVADPGIQLTQMTGFDGRTDGSYTINGVPPGDYFIVVEPLGGDDQYLDSLPLFTRVDTDFTAEFLDATESDCAQDTDPKAQDSVPVGATGTKIADFKVEGASLALVIDVTGSMGPELVAMKVGLDAMISGIEATGGTFPKTAIVTFDDASQLRTVSRDPDKLRDVINNLTTHSTADCPEGSNRALMTAGRQLGSGGVAVLVTDADSHRTGPSREAVEEFYRSKGARLNTMLSGSCPPAQNPPEPRNRRTPLLAPLSGTTPDGPAPVDRLGVENAVRTFSEESLFTGGLFTFQPEIKTSTADANTRYADTLANLGISAVRPAVAGVNPAALPRGTTLDVELTGSNTDLRSGSTVAVAGGGVTATVVRVLSPTRLVVRFAVSPSAALGFRDVTVSTNRGDGSLETAKGIGAVQVTNAPSGPAILAVTPSAGAAGSTEDVTISGGLTHFTAASQAAFGDSVTVNHVTAISPTRAVASVTIAPGAAIGFRDVTVQTGGETAGETVPGPFLVTAATPAVARLTRAAPAAGARGATVDVTLTGADTAFGGGSVASVSGTGVQVLSTTVHSPTSALARLRIAPTAPLGFRDLRVTTGVQDAALLDGFEVTPRTATPIPCADRTPPAAAFGSVRAKQRRLRLRGSAGDTGCAASAVARVEVAISRKARRRCRFVTRSGRLSRARACGKPVWLKAAGTTRWTLSTKRKLPRGLYTVRVRARDVAGNVQTSTAKRTKRIR